MLSLLLNKHTEVICFVSFYSFFIYSSISNIIKYSVKSTNLLSLIEICAFLFLFKLIMIKFNVGIFSSLFIAKVLVTFQILVLLCFLKKKIFIWLVISKGLSIFSIFFFILFLRNYCDKTHHFSLTRVSSYILSLLACCMGLLIGDVSSSFYMKTFSPYFYLKFIMYSSILTILVFPSLLKKHIYLITNDKRASVFGVVVKSSNYVLKNPSNIVSDLLGFFQHSIRFLLPIMFLMKDNKGTKIVLAGQCLLYITKKLHKNIKPICKNISSENLRNILTSDESILLNSFLAYFFMLLNPSNVNNSYSLKIISIYTFFTIISLHIQSKTFNMENTFSNALRKGNWTFYISCLFLILTYSYYPLSFIESTMGSIIIYLSTNIFSIFIRLLYKFKYF